MGNDCEKPVLKNGIPYVDIVHALRPGDLILFSGDTFVSNLIKVVERLEMKRKIPSDDLFSHVGMIVTSDILDHPKVKKGKLYIWESTTGGVFSEKVPNIDGVLFDGVQLRDFESVFRAYDAPNDTRIAVAHLKYPLTPSCRPLFTRIFNTYNGIPYDSNPYSLVSAVFPCLRCLRRRIETLFHTSDWLFCSELVATVYQRLNLIPPAVNPKDVLPMDLLGYDTDNHPVPVVVQVPPMYMVSPMHCIKN